MRFIVVFVFIKSISKIFNYFFTNGKYMDENCVKYNKLT